MRRSFIRRRPTPPLIAIAILVALLLGRWLRQPAAPPPVTKSGQFIVKRVVDGDTLLLQNGNRVRLLGVDTPETKHPDKPVQPWGPEASEFTRQRVEGKQVRLEFDKERRDRHGRILAYVYFKDRFLNEELILVGLSPAVTRFPYSEAMKRKFRKAETAAREKKLGIWSTEKPQRNAISK